MQWRHRFKDFARRFRQRAQSERRTLPAAFLSSLAWFPMGGLEDAFRTIGNTQLAANRKLAAAAGIGVTPDAPKFSFPVCLIWGEDDHTCPVAGAYEIANFIPRAEVHVLQGECADEHGFVFLCLLRDEYHPRDCNIATNPMPLCDLLFLRPPSLCRH